MFIIVFALLGAVLFFTLAASTTANTEAELGSVTPDVVKGADTTASAGKYITFIGTSSGADLVVTDLTWSPAAPQNDTAVTFTAIIKNQGSMRTPDDVIQGVGYFINNVEVAWNADRTQGIEPGESVTLSATGGFNGVATWTPTAAGNYTVRAHVDDADRIIESNKANNTLEKIVTVTQSSTPPPGGPPRTGLTLAYTDNFTNGYDTSVWYPRTDGPNPPGYYDGYQYWTAEDAYPDGQGNQVLRIQKRNYCGTDGCSEYTAGKIVSERSDIFGGPGYYEARFKLPRGKGFWNGWWMYASDTQAEIDIVEDVNSSSGCVAGGVGYCLGIHWWPNGQRNSKNLPASIDDAEWHIYGLDWTITYLKFYVDGVLQYTETNATIMNEMNRSHQWDMRFRTVVGSTDATWPGPPDPNAPYPSYMYIDYIKAWH